jgi:hypothetical protein
MKSRLGDNQLEAWTTKPGRAAAQLPHTMSEAARLAGFVPGSRAAITMTDAHYAGGERGNKKRARCGRDVLSPRKKDAGGAVAHLRSPPTRFAAMSIMTLSGFVKCRLHCTASLRLSR